MPPLLCSFPLGSWRLPLKLLVLVHGGLWNCQDLSVWSPFVPGKTFVFNTKALQFTNSHFIPILYRKSKKFTNLMFLPSCVSCDCCETLGDGKYLALSAVFVRDTHHADSFFRIVWILTQPSVGWISIYRLTQPSHLKLGFLLLRRHRISRQCNAVWNTTFGYS